MSIWKKVLDWSLGGNYWLWFHIFAALVGSKIALQILPFEFVRLIPVGVLIAAVVWEVIEYKIEFNRLREIYGGTTDKEATERFLYDATGDIVCAVLASWILCI
jgi:hypothetical protein